ncbi:hypothetical protein BS17DRAFT_769369 [Gyrodon lividus]|nr:hypothetical protein BS17DRAFT_769369 [Gyrodon lividus]
MTGFTPDKIAIWWYIMYSELMEILFQKVWTYEWHSAKRFTTSSSNSSSSCHFYSESDLSSSKLDPVLNEFESEPDLGFWDPSSESMPASTTSMKQMLVNTSNIAGLKETYKKHSCLNALGKSLTDLQGELNNHSCKERAKQHQGNKAHDDLESSCEVEENECALIPKPMGCSGQSNGSW